MKEPNRKFSTYRLTISVADYAQPEKWNPNLSVQHWIYFWNLPEFLQSNSKTFKYLVKNTQHLMLVTFLSARAQNLLDHRKEDCWQYEHISSSCSFVHMQSELCLKCEWKSMMVSNNMEKGVVVYLPHLSWSPASANHSQCEKLGLKSTVLEPYKQWFQVRPFEPPLSPLGCIQQYPSAWNASQSQPALQFAVLGWSPNDNGA